MITNNTRQLLSSAVAAALLSMPAAASASEIAYNASPVTVTACSVDTNYVAPQAYFQGLELSSLSTGFVNRANVSATRVKLLVNDGQSTKTVDERGTFAPGTNIDRYNVNGITAGGIGASPSCSIAEVDFADGSTWHAANANVATR